MGATAAVGAVVGGALLSSNGAKKAGEAASDSAYHQQLQADANRQENRDITNAPSIAALGTYEKAIAAQEGDLTRQQQLVSQIDPTIIEASQQALKLLRGESSSALAPMQAQRAQDRQKLVNTLREQLGPGAETSTAGIQALTRFDAQTSQNFASAQQQALGNISNVFGQFSASRPNIGSATSTLGNLGAGRAGVAFNQAAALSGAQGQLYNSAGYNGISGVVQGNQQAAFGNSLMNAGASAAGSYFKSPAPSNGLTEVGSSGPTLKFS